MPEQTLQLIAATFSDRAGALRVLDAILMARARMPGGILDAAAVTRAIHGALVVQGAAESMPDGGLVVSAAMGEVLALLEGADARHRRGRSAQAPADWKRAVRALDSQLRGVAKLLTPTTSVLATIVAPAGAGEAVGVVLNEASRLTVEDLPAAAVRALADAPALVFDGSESAAAPRGRGVPRPIFATVVPSTARVPLPPPS